MVKKTHNVPLPFIAGNCSLKKCNTQVDIQIAAYQPLSKSRCVPEALPLQARQWSPVK